MEKIPSDRRLGATTKPVLTLPLSGGPRIPQPSAFSLREGQEQRSFPLRKIITGLPGTAQTTVLLLVVVVVVRCL
jgi:hypothetical protein